MRPLAGGAFAPAGQAFGADFGQQHATVAGDAEAGFKWAYEGNVQFTQDDCIDSHKFVRFLETLDPIRLGWGDPVRRFHFLPHPGESQARPTPVKMPFETSVGSPTARQELFPVLRLRPSTRRWRPAR